MKWAFKFALFICCFFIVARFCKEQTGKFTILRITSHLTYRPEWDIAPLSPTEMNQVKTILNQPYSYLSRGVQSFVFASADGQYVIKFFRHDHMTAPFWSKFLGRESKKGSKVHKDFLSYKIAYEELKKETGLVFLHLNKTDTFHQTLDLVDKLGIHHPIDLDKYEFLVQKRADLLYTALDQMVEEKRLDAAKETLTNLVHLLAHRTQQGISDKDPDLNTNFGVIGTEPIQIDVGRFRKGPVRLDKNEIIRITDHLHQKLMVQCPALDNHLKNQIEQL